MNPPLSKTLVRSCMCGNPANGQHSYTCDAYHWQQIEAGYIARLETKNGHLILAERRIAALEAQLAELRGGLP